MDGKQREINHVNSYSAANIGTSTNNAFSAQPTLITKTPSGTPIAASSSSGSISITPTQDPIQATKGVEDNMALMAGFMNCYNAFVAGDLVPPVMMGELDQIHPDDVEEMDISWHIAMPVFRANKFSQRTGKNNWVIQGDKRMGFNKTKPMCYNCHEE